MYKEIWNKFVLANGGSFLQSYEWGEFQRGFGRRVFRFKIDGPPSSREGDFGEAMQAQFIEMTAPVINKKYWYAPRGPVIANSQWPIADSKIKEFIKTVKNEAEKEGVMFFRIGPSWDLTNHQALVASGFYPLHYDIEPSQTLILDLGKTEEELLAQMHEKWRYNIRLAERKGVVIKIISAGEADFERCFEEFYKLVDSGTSERKEIKHHPKEYYRQQLEMNPPPARLASESVAGRQPSFEKGGSNSSSPLQGEVRGDLVFYLFIAEYENKVIAANILAVFGDTATYLHGATSSEHRDVMAPHLLQWEQIKFAKQVGCLRYDFCGIVNEHTLDKRGVSWAGFTRFKKGFGGRDENYVGYFDYSVNKFWYFVYQLAQKIRR